MGFGKCHLFFSSDKMKFFLFLLFLLLLLDNPQGSTIARRRSIRALNTTLQTNFNGTYERRNPCTNTEIERTSYVASHEFCHHSKEDNWNDYTHKCSSIISNFLKVLGNLVRFNHKENGTFNFHINTSISQKQDGKCEPGKWSTCKTLPTITIEATDCEISPKISCQNSPVDDAEFLSEQEDERKDFAGDEETPVEAYINQDPVLPTSQCQVKVPVTPLEDESAIQTEENISEPDNMWITDDILPEEEIATQPEVQFLKDNGLAEDIKTEDSAGGVSTASEDLQTTYGTEQNSDFFELPGKLTTQLESKNYVPPTEENLENSGAEGRVIFSEPFSHLPWLETPPNEEQPQKSFTISKKQPTAYSKQLFNDNLEKSIPVLSQQPVDSSLSQISSPSFNSKEAIPIIEIYQPQTIFETDPTSSQQPLQPQVRQNEEIHADQNESSQELERSENLNIQQTDANSYQSPAVDEDPLSEISNPKLPKIPDFVPRAKESLDYDGETSTLEFAMSYPEPIAQIPLEKNSREKSKTLTDYDSDEDVKQTTYSSEFSKAQPPSENLDSVPSAFTLSPDQEVTFSDKLSTFNVKQPYTPTPSWTPQGEFPTKPTDIPSFETPFSSSDEDNREDTLDPVDDAEFLTPSDQYQSTKRPESQSLIINSDQTGNNRESEQAFAQSEPEFASQEPLPSFSSTFSSAELAFPPESPKLSSPSQNLPPVPFGNDELLNDESGPSFFQKQAEPRPDLGSIPQAFPEEYLRTLPPDQKSIENSEQVLTTSNPYEDQPLYLSQPLNVEMTKPISSAANSKQPPFFDSPLKISNDYEDLLYSKPEMEPTFKTFDSPPDTAKPSQFSEQNPVTPYTPDPGQEDHLPRPFKPSDKDDLSDGQSFVTPLRPDFNAPDITEAVTTVDNQNNDLQSVDSDKSRKLSPQLLTTALSENTMIETQVKESSSLDHPLNSPTLVEESSPGLSAPIMYLNENDFDFQTEKEQPFEASQSPTPVYPNQSFSPEIPSPYERNQYPSAEQRAAQTTFPEYDSSASSEYLPTEKPVEGSEIPVDNYNTRNDFVAFSPVGRQQTDTYEPKTTKQFSSLNSKESSTDFFLNTEQPYVQSYSDSVPDQVKLNSEVLKSPSPTSALDQLRPLESQIESNPSFSNDESLSSFSEETPLELTENRDLQITDFQTSNTQSENIPLYSSNPLDNVMNSQNAAFDNISLTSALPSETEIYNMDNKTPDQQPAIESPQPKLPPFDQTYDKESTDYSLPLEPTPQIPLLGDDYSKKLSAPQRENSFTDQTSFQEYSDITSIAPSVSEFDPTYDNERLDSEQVKEINPPKPQDSSENLTPIPNDNITEKDSENSSSFEVNPEGLAANNQYSDNINIYSQDANDNRDPLPKANYLDQLPNRNIDINVQNRNFIQKPDLITGSPVPNEEFNPNEFTSLRPSAFPSDRSPIVSDLKPAELLNESSQGNFNPIIPPRDVSKTQLLQKADDFENVSQQSQQATAAKFADEISDISQAFKPQPQRSLNFENPYLETPYAAPSKFEPSSISSQKSNIGFDSSNNEPPLLIQPQMQELDTMTGSLDQTSDNFEPKLSSPTPNKATDLETSEQTIETIDQLPNEQPSYNPEYSSFSNEQEPQPYNNQFESEPQEPFSGPGMYGRFSPRFPPREPENMNQQPFPALEAQRFAGLNNEQQNFNPEKQFQTQTTSRIPQPFDTSSVNTEENQSSSLPQYQNQYPNFLNTGSNELIRSISEESERPINNQPTFDPQIEPYNEAGQPENFFEQALPRDSVSYPQAAETDPLPDQIISRYDDYDRESTSQLPNEKLLENNEEIAANLDDQKGRKVQTNQQQSSDMIEQPLEDSNDYQDELTPDSEPPSSSPAHSNPLIQSLEHHLSFPVHEHLRPSPFSDPEQGSSNDFFPIDPQNQSEFRGAPVVPPYSEERGFEDVVNALQSDSQALVSDPIFPSSKPGEDCVSCCGLNPAPLLCPFDPILKGNMTAPSYYILISKLPVDEHEEEQFKVEKVYLGDGKPLNCTLSTGKTFPTWLYTPIPFARAGIVKLRTKSDFA